MHPNASHPPFLHDNCAKLNMLSSERFGGKRSFSIGAPGSPPDFLDIGEHHFGYGVLFIFDKVMCGMGRTGTLQAWGAEGVVPDIEVIGKSLGSGYVPISTVLVTKRVVSALQGGSKYFKHGQTYHLPVLPH